jgi:hypothetical protein
MVLAKDNTQQKKKALNIGSRLELFVDRYLIEKLENAELKLHRPHKEPSANNPGGGYMTVIKDGNIYRAYYRDKDPSYKGKMNYSGHPGEITCYAESNDGKKWTFPNLGIYEVNGSTNNNVILAKKPPFSHNFSPFLDTRAGVDTNEKFKALAGHPGHNKDGLHSFVSADGIHWSEPSEKEVIPYDKSWSHAFDSQNVSFWSETEQKYVCYFRTWKSRHGKLRTIYRTTSDNFKNWSKPAATEPNLPGEHLYTSQTHPYFRAPHIYISLPTRYQPDRGSSTDIMFMSSRAGQKSFTRLFKYAFIRPGLSPERWGNRSNYVALNAVPTGPAEMSIYHNKDKHRYTLRTDGFVSVNAEDKQAEFITKPIVFKGEKLILNYSTSAAGSIVAELQHPDGTPIPGFTAKDCKPIIGDHISGDVEWKSDKKLKELSGKPIRLRFVMKECDLYSLKFCDLDK